VDNIENVNNDGISNSRNWTSMIIRVIVNYLILGTGALIGANYFSFWLYLIPLITFGANYYSAKDRYELYFLNSSLLIFSMIVFMMALLSNCDIEVSAFGMLFSSVGILEFSIVTLILDKIKRTRTNDEKLSEDEEEKIKFGMVGAKLTLGIIIGVFIVFFIL